MSWRLIRSTNSICRLLYRLLLWHIEKVTYQALRVSITHFFRYGTTQYTTVPRGGFSSSRSPPVLQSPGTSWGPYLNGSVRDAQRSDISSFPSTYHNGTVLDNGERPLDKSVPGPPAPGRARCPRGARKVRLVDVPRNSVANSAISSQSTVLTNLHIGSVLNLLNPCPAQNLPLRAASMLRSYFGIRQSAAPSRFHLPAYCVHSDAAQVY
jgi:hypothetical protein